MNIIVYMDVFFFYNFIMDYFLLTIVSYIRKQKVSRRRRILGALCAAVSACVLVILLPFEKLGLLVYGYAAVALLMILVTFFPCSVKMLVKHYLFFLLSSFCLAGILLSLGIAEDTFVAEIRKENRGMLFFFYVFSYLIPVLLFLWYRRRLPEEENCLFQVMIRYGERVWRGVAFLDTGNLLVNPLDGKPVVLLEKNYFKELIGDGFEATEEEFFKLSEFCVIPFRSAGTKQGVFYGVKTTEIIFEKNNEQWKQKGIVAVCCENLIPSHKEYQLLMGKRLIAL